MNIIHVRNASVVIQFQSVSVKAHSAFSCYVSSVSVMFTKKQSIN
jgi:hypothetical protein